MGNHQLVFIGWWQGTDGYCAWERLRRRALQKYLASVASALFLLLAHVLRRWLL
jgi:hypothetical protein